MLLADNYIRAVDNNTNYNAVVDEAGDFATDSDRTLSAFPAQALVDRIYFDPFPTRVVKKNESGQPLPAPGMPGYYQTEPRSVRDAGRIEQPPVANFVAVKALSAGAGLVVYNGHSNHWQFARTSEQGWPNWLFYTNDVDLLLNYGKPFIGLSMTCYTSQFVIPAAAGTLDELTFRKPDAGSVAVWGPSGLSVTHGHDLLQRGFMRRLWSNPSMSQPMGELLEAGYTELLLNSSGLEDTLMTFLLLGDPLTKARVTANRGLFLPEIAR
ncbi:MAG: hypothetical protein IPK16_25785 [Anaerolineales bacterium]|nr:hypothetical protein [Anaerolineales bacterium]